MPDGHFAFIPKDTTHSKELNSLPVTARWLYAILIAERHGRTEAFSFPYTEIEAITGFSSSTIRRGIVELESGGFLEYEKGGLERNTNRYLLAKDWLHI